MTITKEQVLKISNYLKLIHHTKGRIRISIDKNIKDMRKEFDKFNISIDKAKEIVKNIKGVKEFKLIALLGTITILYDSEIFPSYILEDFVNGENSEEVTAFLNNLIKENLS